MLGGYRLLLIPALDPPIHVYTALVTLPVYIQGRRSAGFRRLLVPISLVLLVPGQLLLCVEIAVSCICLFDYIFYHVH